VTPYAHSAFEAAQARCRFRLATDEVMHMLQFSRDGGPHTTPFFVYYSEPMPLDRACGTLECRQGRGAPCATGCQDERLSAQAEGARMGMGDMAPSAPADLDAIDGFWRRAREDDLAAARGILGWSLALLSVVATVSAVAWVLR
jgi:hypothetical protein